MKVTKPKKLNFSSFNPARAYSNPSSINWNRYTEGNFSYLDCQVSEVVDRF
jgi:hypothetical protein